ncbi:MAG: beta-galactosidase [Puniceicoccaceae bacterium]
MKTPSLITLAAPFTWGAFALVLLTNNPAHAGNELPHLSGDWELKSADEQGLVITLNGATGSGRALFNLEEAPLDLTAYSYLNMQLTNSSEARLDVTLKTTSEDLKDDRYAKGRFFLKGGEEEALMVFLNRPYFPDDHPWKEAFGRIRGLPGGHQSNWRYLDISTLRLVEIKVHWEGNRMDGGVVTLSWPHGAGTYLTDSISPDDLPKPLVDMMGQLRGESWEGKVIDEGELPEDGKRDLASYSGHAVRAGFTQYGGWKDGPRYEATGHFHTKKIDGKWWFVDPEGYLFWSLGVTGVGGGAATKISGREAFFPDLSDSPFFREDATIRGYDFIEGNLYRKYGDGWKSDNAEVTLGRMRACGMNTIGAWSVDSVLGQDKVPYTIILHPKLQGLGSLNKVPDPFSNQFRKSLKSMVKEAAGKYAGDPWNLGIFIDNELKWGRGIQLANEVVGLKPSIPAKKAMIRLLREKYATIEELNASWGTDFGDFKAIRGMPSKQGTDAYKADMAAFQDHLADTYFAYCAKLLDEYMPGHLYLGSRFHGAIYDGKNTIVQNAASRHVDVMSYNIYKTSINDAVLHQEVDRPVIIGEFHFGTGSHGVWGYGLGPCNSMEHQAELYSTYVNEALSNPHIIGTHWFKWSDHPTTGRYDGENYRIGIVSITDRPYKTLTDAIKGVASGMYPLRQTSK